MWGERDAFQKGTSGPILKSTQSETSHQVNHKLKLNNKICRYTFEHGEKSTLLFLENSLVKLVDVNIEFSFP